MEISQQKKLSVHVVFYLVKVDIWQLIAYLFIFNKKSIDENFLYHMQHPEAFCKKGFIKGFANFTEKHLRWSLFLVKFIIKRLQNRCFPATFATKVLRTPILNNICDRLLLPFLTCHRVIKESWYINYLTRSSNRITEFNGDLIIDLWVPHPLHGIKDCKDLMK